MKYIFLFLLLQNFLYSQDLIPMCQKENKCGYVKKGTKKFIIKPEFFMVKEFCYSNKEQKSIAFVFKKGKWFVINEKGKKISNLYFNEIKDCKNGVFIAKKNNLYAYFDENLKQLTPFEFQDALNLKEELAPVKKNNYWGIYDFNKNEFYPTKYEEILPFSENLSRVKHKEKYGYIDKNLNEVLPPIYDKAFDFKDGFTSASLDLSYGFINIKYLTFKKKDFENIGPYTEQLSWAQKIINNEIKCGYIDKDGNIKIDFNYTMCTHFSNGLAAVLKNIKGKWGFIDKTGKQIINFKYDKVFGFKNDICKVILKNKVFFIDKNGFEYKN